ncbi:hypothetical protein FJY84_04270, partial [Candidatus Bathyarchaeota archaeon]|nr:hypothetical protein [Candidatus Bathyarchaeota archaeon]
MANQKRQYNTVDEFIALYPKNIQDLLEQIRLVIKKAAPEAEETIRYGIPTYRLNGNLVHFSAYKKHIGFYPAPSAIEAFKEELSNYETSKGAIKFPIDKPIPFELIKKIVEYRVK